MPGRKYTHPAPLTLAIGSALAVSTTQAAVITVDTNADPGSPDTCSLRSAIESVNSLNPVDGCESPSYGDPNEIVFDAGVTGSIELDGDELIITEPVTITGPGAGELIINAQGDSGVFAIEYAGQVNISGLTITGGSRSSGGGVYLFGYAALDLSDCVISNNSASLYGGGVFQYALGLEIDNCEITENSSGLLGGGVAVSLGQANVRNSTISENSAYEIGGGLWVEGLYFEGDDPVLSGPSSSRGGANGIQSSLNVESSVITGNQAQVGGGIGAGRYSSPSGGPLSTYPLMYSRGSAPREPGPNLVVSDSSVSDNQAIYGGGVGAWGIYTEEYYGPLVVRGLGESYGFHNLIEIEQSSIENNSALAGGGLATKYTDSYLFDTDVVDNEAVEFGGGMINLGNSLEYGGIYANDERGILGGPYKYMGVYGGLIAGNHLTGENGYGELGIGLDDPLLGAGIANFQAFITLYGTEVMSNTGADFGGGVTTVMGASFIAFSQISGNEGGGLFSFNNSISGLGYSRVENNLHQGGMICEYGGICDVKYSSISENEGVLTGGVAANLDVFDGAQRNHQSLLGSGQRRGSNTTGVYLGNSTVSSNLGGEVGGLAGTDIELVHATVANNQQVDSLNSTSISRGVSRVGGLLLFTNDDFLINHTILAGNSTDDASGVNDLSFPGPDPIEMNFSLVQDDDGITADGDGNILGEDPLLGPLDFNGSAWSRTHALLEGSPAIDAGNASLPPTSFPDHDQRGPGFPRIFNEIIDIGAYEFIIDGIFADRFESPPE